MILMKDGEEMDFLFRCKARIDGRGVGSGWFYVTDRRVAFESDKHGLCFTTPNTSIDGQKAGYWGRFKFTWIEQTAKGPWRFLFQGKLEKWDGWKPKASYVEWLLRGVSYGAKGPMGAGWRWEPKMKFVYNEIQLAGARVLEMSGETPEDQRTYRRWRYTKAMLEDDDFSFEQGKYDNDNLERIHAIYIKTENTSRAKFEREYRRDAKAFESADEAGRRALEKRGITERALEDRKIQCAVQRRIVQILRREYRGYTFCSQLPQRVDELRDALIEAYMAGQNISRHVPPTNVHSAMVEARRDVAEYRRKLKVRLPA